MLDEGIRPTVESDDVTVIGGDSFAQLAASLRRFRDEFQGIAERTGAVETLRISGGPTRSAESCHIPLTVNFSRFDDGLGFIDTKAANDMHSHREVSPFSTSKTNTFTMHGLSTHTPSQPSNRNSILGVEPTPGPVHLVKHAPTQASPRHHSVPAGYIVTTYLPKYTLPLMSLTITAESKHHVALATSTAAILPWKSLITYSLGYAGQFWRRAITYHAAHIEPQLDVRSNLSGARRQR